MKLLTALTLLAKIVFTSPGREVVNGNVVSGRCVTIRDGVIEVDGVHTEFSSGPDIRIEVHGMVHELATGTGDVVVHGQVGGVRSSTGDISCGDVAGSVTASTGDVRCGTVAGPVRSSTGDIYTGQSA